jgi:hypothetical protein
MTGHGIASWVHIDDVAKATADAVTKGRGGQIYNIVDDRPQSFGDYARELSKKLHRPPLIPISHRLVGMVASYPATAFGTTWLPLSNAKAKAELGWTPIPGDIRSRIAQHGVLGPDPHVEHKGVGDGEHDRRQPCRMHKGQRHHFRGHRRVIGVL